MGHWEWERGEFKLPTADFARIRGIVAAADRAHKEKVLGATQEFWKGLTAREKRDPEAYRAAVSAFLDKMDHEDAPASSYDRYGAYKDPEWSKHELHDFEWKVGGWGSAPPKRVLVSDMDYPSNKTLDFAGHDVGISFNRADSSVSYTIDENRHTIENAYGSQVLSGLLKEIDGMKWTRGTGGRTWSDNEYAAEARQEHGGFSDLTNAGYGPLGAEQAPMQTRPWKDPKGDTFHAKSVATKFGVQGRVQKGVPAGGQFSERYRPESNVFLR